MKAADAPPRAQPEAPAARLEHVSRVYATGEAQVRALDNVTLDFPAGSYSAIVGQSGSGKSTLLNVLGLLDRPTSGHYLLGGEDVSGLGDDRLSEARGRRLGFVFQSFHLIPHLTVLENIEVPMEYAGVPAHEMRARARELATRMGLANRLEHRPAQLSGGQQQRVAIARALANRPLVLLADEPTGNLDSATGMEILALLDELHAQGTTLVVVTHDPKVAARAGRVVRMLDGRVESVTGRAEARP
ncbi:MAG: ABC transporter ATP-binding protein [Planctomycetia bacterium]